MAVVAQRHQPARLAVHADAQPLPEPAPRPAAGAVAGRPGLGHAGGCGWRSGRHRHRPRPLPATPAGRAARRAAAGDAGGHGLRRRGARARDSRGHRDVAPVACPRPHARADGPGPCPRTPRRRDATLPPAPHEMKQAAEPAMNATHHPTPDDTGLHALVDGRLPSTEAERVRAGLDAAASQQAAAWERQRALLRALHGDWLERPMPDALRQVSDRLQQVQQDRRRWASWGGMAAGWMLAFGLGWGLHGHWASGTTVAARAASSPLQFVQQAAVAYAVYQPEQRHPVEVTAAQQDHLVQWLSKRLARPLTVPHLQGQGFELVGGRLLPGGSGARAQFMYQNAAGTRITLYLGALDTRDDARAAQATAFRFHSEGAVSSFYWMDQGFGYALSGELPQPALQTLATAVYRQLSAAPPGGVHAP